VVAARAAVVRGEGAVRARVAAVSARVGAAEELFAVGGLRARAARAETMAVLAAEEAMPESSMRALLGTKGGGRGGR